MVSACTGTSTLQPDLAFKPPDKDATILLMPADVEVSELTAGGLLEPNSEWTSQARTHLDAALQETLSANDVRLVNYQAPDHEVLTFDPAHFEIVKLHETVGSTILTHKFQTIMPLPTKPGFDWSLGPNAKLLGDDYGADFVLFVTFRDSFSSPGRAAAIIVGALLGVGIPGGRQRAFASLVEVETGEIIWFTRLASSVGDLREEKGARDAVAALFEDLPK